METPKYLYRYERGFISWMETIITCITVNLCKYSVISVTPKGFWIDYYGTAKFVLGPDNAKKRFAYLTKEEAWNNFIARTQSAIKFQKSALKVSEAYLKCKQPED